MDTKYKTEEEYLTRLKGLVDVADARCSQLAIEFWDAFLQKMKGEHNEADIDKIIRTVCHWGRRHEKLEQAYFEIRKSLYHQN